MTDNLRRSVTGADGTGPPPAAEGAFSGRHPVREPDRDPLASPLLDYPQWPLPVVGYRSTTNERGKMTVKEDDAARRAAAQHTLAEHLRLTAAGRVDEWVTLFASDAVLEFPYAPAGVPQRVTGRDALRAHMSNFPETFDVEFVDLVFHETVDPSLVIAEFRSKGTALPTGKPYEQTCISVVRTDDDARITHYLDYWNPLVAIEALTPHDVPSDPDLSVTFGG
ncbi:nuclear transport factor 2 family protein [Streptomyces dysideae]|nr:nuclear transport factor 2 family protein [Streptomyces dysideae]